MSGSRCSIYAVHRCGRRAYSVAFGCSLFFFLARRTVSDTIGRVGAYCGSVYLEQGICWVSDNAIFAKSKITKDEFFDYFLLKRLNLFNHHVGTGQQLLTQEILNNIEVPKPVTEQIELFNRKAASVFETIFTNSREIIRLQELSDLLLSRLAG
ncbi:hypothetical protein GPK69_03525 [Roseburia inulinivorans]|nr:hypothetical protein [Roseburia inulinivorans]